MWKKLFGKRAPAPPARDVAALVAPLALPSVQVRGQDAPSRSHLGGLPDVPPGFAWPRHDGRPLAFLARIELADVQRAQPFDWLPGSGALLFFYDVAEMPWGYDPAHRGGWAVLHVADGASAPAAKPATIQALPRRNVAFRAARSLPSVEHASVDALELDDGEIDALCELQEQTFEDEPHHQIGGHPDPVQGDSMQLESQLASHGVFCGKPEGYETPEARALEAGAVEWKLLLQLDSDDALDVMWGDAGRLYFWVQESAARRGDFTNTWLVLQCH